MRQVRSETATVLRALGCAIGEGLVAGAVGTAAITAAQIVEMRLTGRSPSDTPQRAGGIVLGVRPIDEARAGRFGTMVHWFYGTVWGIPRGMLALAGIGGITATALHFVKMWVGGMILLSVLKVSSPPWRWGMKALATDGLLHVVYAAAAGALFDRVHRRRCA